MIFILVGLIAIGKYLSEWKYYSHAAEVQAPLMNQNLQF